VGAGKLDGSTFNRARKVLVADGYVNDSQGVRSARYKLTEAGRAALGVTIPDTET